MVARARAPEEKRTRLDQRMWGTLTHQLGQELVRQPLGRGIGQEQEQIKNGNMVII